jgi:hypothetical protein
VGYVPEAEAYDQLVEFERRLDATLLRKQLDIQESKQGKTSRVRLQHTRRTRHNAPAPHVTRNANLRAFIIIIDDDDRRRRSCACSSTTPTTISRATTTSTRY